AAVRKLKAKREADEAKRQADEARRKRLEEERKRQAIAEAKKKAAEEARRRVLADAKKKADEAKRKIREADWATNGIPINERRGLDKKTKAFKNQFIIVIKSSDMLELFPEKNLGGVVTGLKVLAGCRYYNPIIINRTQGKIHVSAFKLVSNKVSLFGNAGSRAGISIKNSPQPGRIYPNDETSARLAAKVQHNRFKNARIRESLSDSDRRFFVNNYGCAEQIKGLTMFYKPEDLNTVDASMKNSMKPKNIVVLIDSGNTRREFSRIKVETESN
ncbi:MAG: hypothetical protein CMM75_06325, partial [Rhodospirillaceae bacterium]|nr:hypothetical protein [Rhodospirillaceae bacterium]